MLDTVKYPDGTTSGTHIGGPAIFAYAGIKLWDDDCQMLTNVGSDGNGRFLIKASRQAGIDMDHVQVVKGAASCTYISLH